MVVARGTEKFAVKCGDLELSQIKPIRHGHVFTMASAPLHFKVTELQKNKSHPKNQKSSEASA